MRATPAADVHCTEFSPGVLGLSRRDASFKTSHMGQRLKNYLQPRLNRESVFLFADSGESTLWYHLAVMQTTDTRVVHGL